MDMQIGRWVGVLAKKRGAAKFTEKDAQAKSVARRPLSRMIALLDMPTGWLDGVWARKRGAVRTKEKDAPLRQEVVRESFLIGYAMQ